MSTRRFQSGSGIPNNPDLPVIIYHQVIDRNYGSTDYESLFRSNQWGGIWKNGIFSYHHFHSNAHEVLGVANGTAQVRLGGEEGETYEFRAGDVVLLPAGTGHMKVTSKSLLVVGAYPSGQSNYDLNRCQNSIRPEDMDRISDVPLPETDPVFGKQGPAFDHWRQH